MRLAWVVIPLILIGVIGILESFADLGYIIEGQYVNELFNPSDVAVDSNGHIYIVDVINNKIKHYDSSGNLLSEWGSFCYFEYHLDDCIDPDGTFGLLSKGDGQFRKPTHIAVDDNRIYVADDGNYRIQVFDKEGNFLFKFGNHGRYGSNGIAHDSTFSRISGLEVNNEGQIYVSDLENHRIQVFNKDGWHIKTFGDPTWLTKGSHKMSGLILDNENNSYLINDRTMTITKFDASGNQILTFGSPGVDPDKHIQLQTGFDPNRLLQHLESIEVNNEGQIYIAGGQFSSSYVDVFDPYGEYLYSFIDRQKKSDKFTSISDITLDTNGQLYVADNMLGHVVVFSNTAEYMFTIDGTEIIIESSLISENIDTALLSGDTPQPSFFDKIFRFFKTLFN